MKNNRSLKLSHMLKHKLTEDLFSPFQEMFPTDIIMEEPKTSERRNRVFTQENTLLAMTLSSLQPDSSLQQSVQLFSRIHDQQAKALQELARKEIAEYKASGKKRVGRPRKDEVSLPKSKQKPISLNTSAYSQARNRLDLDYMQKVFRETSRRYKRTEKFEGMEVYLADGTYFQTQDTASLRKVYEVSKRGSYQTEPPFPQGLLQVIIRESDGLIVDYGISNRQSSELALVSPMLTGLPSGSLLIADDLYNSYGLFVRAQAEGIHLLVPGKRDRNYEVIEEYAEGDQIVELRASRRPSWYQQEEELPKSIRVRRIEVADSVDPSKTRVFYTTVLDKKINKYRLSNKFYSRWDVEVSILEIKSFLGLRHTRSKSPEMLEKEICAAMIAYNFVRVLIAKATESGGFPPSEAIYEEYYPSDRVQHIDRRGRVYVRVSTGRPKTNQGDTEAEKQEQTT